MWQAILSVLVCLAVSSVALGADAVDKKAAKSGKSVVNESQTDQAESEEKPGYHSWIEDDLLPTTRENFKRKLRYRYRCTDLNFVDVRPSRPYAAIEPYAELSSATKLQFSAKSLLAPTQVLFGKDQRNGFRSAFALSGWDEQENQALAELDETSPSIEMAFPQSKWIVRCANSNETGCMFGGLNFTR